MSDKKRETAKKLLEEAIKANSDGIPILVEGKTDVAALRELGFDGDIFIIKGTGKSLLQLAEQVSNQSEHAIILTDPDRAGSKIAAQLSTVLLANGVNPDLRYRKICALLDKSQVAHLKADF